MDDRCPICQRRRETTDELCSLHMSALSNLERSYSQWNKAFGYNLTKADYYTRLLNLSETGTAAKALIQYLAKGESK